MALEQTSVVTELQTKRFGDNWDITPIGTDIKYISNNRSNSNHNLEEDIILGVNRIITSQTDSQDSSLRKKVEYRTENKNNDYYFLDMTIYGINSDPYVDSSNIKFRSGWYVVDSEIGNNGLHQYEYTNRVNYDIDENRLSLLTDSVCEIDKLYYQGNYGTDPILISTKTIREYYNDENQLIISEVIESASTENNG